MSEPSKSELRAMLHQAVVNTGGALVDNEMPSGSATKSLLVNAKQTTFVQTAPNYSNPIQAIMPTADQVARAIVAAARETGEDPIACASGKATHTGQGLKVTDRVSRAIRCRHYAMHALVRAFPGLPRETYARLVGCPGKPDKFFDNSKMNVLPMKGSDRAAKWWNEAAYQRVVEAIR